MCVQRLKLSPAFYAQRKKKKKADAFPCHGSVLSKVFATVAEPLTQLLSKIFFFWNDHCIIAFEELKVFLKGAPL